MILDEESDEEMRELAKEEMNEAKEQITELEEKLKILLLPKDENDDKNVVVEIRGGAGGDEAALFAAELYRMYCMYAETQHLKTETVSYTHLLKILEGTEASVPPQVGRKHPQQELIPIDTTNILFICCLLYTSR